MTADQHRAIGAILGFPACCVEAFIADRLAGEPAAVKRGTVFEPNARTPEQVADCNMQISGLLAKDDKTAGAHRLYVPCKDHMHTPNWSPWD